MMCALLISWAQPTRPELYLGQWCVTERDRERGQRLGQWMTIITVTTLDLFSIHGFLPPQMGSSLEETLDAVDPHPNQLLGSRSAVRGEQSFFAPLEGGVVN